MFEQTYYHKSIRNLVIGFGALFSKINVQRHDNDNNLIQTVGVPISYGPKEKIFVKLRQDPDQKDYIYTILPRMAFEIVSYNYDASRNMNKMNQIRCYKGDTMLGTYSPVPYNLGIQLHVLTKGAEDGFAIIEQILPLFKPEYILTVKSLEEMNITTDIPIVLDNVQLQDDYEGDFGTRRFVTHTLTFTAKATMYGPVSTSGVILRTETEVHDFAQHISTGDLSTGEITSDFWLEE